MYIAFSIIAFISCSVQAMEHDAAEASGVPSLLAGSGFSVLHERIAAATQVPRIRAEALTVLTGAQTVIPTSFDAQKRDRLFKYLAHNNKPVGAALRILARHIGEHVTVENFVATKDHVFDHIPFEWRDLVKKQFLLWQGLKYAPKSYQRAVPSGQRDSGHWRVAIAPKKDLIATGNMEIYAICGKNQRYWRPKDNLQSTVTQFSGDNTRCAWGANGKVAVMDLTEEDQAKSCKVYSSSEGRWVVGFSSNLLHVFVRDFPRGRWGSTVGVWKLTDPNSVKEKKFSLSGSCKPGILVCDKKLFIATSDNAVHAWNIVDDTLSVVDAGVKVTRMVVSENKQRLALCLDNGYTKIFDTEKQVCTHSVQGKLHVVYLSDDGSLLIGQPTNMRPPFVHDIEKNETTVLLGWDEWRLHQVKEHNGIVSLVVCAECDQGVGPVDHKQHCIMLWDWRLQDVCIVPKVFNKNIQLLCFDDEKLFYYDNGLHVLHSSEEHALFAKAVEKALKKKDPDELRALQMHPSFKTLDTTYQEKIKRQINQLEQTNECSLM